MVSRRVSDLTQSPTKALASIASSFRRRGLDYYSLHAGEPGVPPPREAVSWLAELLVKAWSDLSLYSYTPSEGLIELRELIADDLGRHGRFKPEVDEVIVTTGGMEGLFASLAVATDPGDPVGLVIPAYFHYFNLARFLKVRLVEYVSYPRLEVGEEGWKRLFEGSKAILVSNPDNPTGRVLSRGEARLLADLACDNKVYLIHDIAYYTLYYEGEHEWPERWCMDYVITVGSFSKDPGIPGWRLGFVVAPKHFAEKVRNVREITSYNAPLPSQLLVKYYLETRLRDKVIESVRREYRRRRDAMAEALKEYMPLAWFKLPKAGMFIYVDVSEYLGRGSSEDFVFRLATEKRVLTVPGTFFGRGGEKWVRLSFTREPPERIREAVAIIASALSDRV